MADSSGHKRKWAECPYAESDEHSKFVAHRNGVSTGVCERHICQGVGGCPNAMLPPGWGMPYCARKECQAMRWKVLGDRYLPPEMWFEIARHADPTDLAFLRGVDVESDAGVEMVVARLRKKHAADTPPGKPPLPTFTQDSAAMGTSRSRWQAYATAIPPEDRRAVLMRAARAHDVMGVQAMLEAGTLYTTDVAVAYAAHIMDKPPDLLDWLEAQGMLAGEELDRFLAMLIRAAKRDEDFGRPARQYISAVFWALDRPRANGVVVQQAARVQRCFEVAMREKNLGVLEELTARFPEVRAMRDVCVAYDDLVIPQAGQDAFMSRAHPHDRPRAFACFPGFCPWAREHRMCEVIEVESEDEGWDHVPAWARDPVDPADFAFELSDTE